MHAEIEGGVIHHHIGDLIGVAQARFPGAVGRAAVEVANQVGRRLALPAGLDDLPVSDVHIPSRQRAIAEVAAQLPVFQPVPRRVDHGVPEIRDRQHAGRRQFRAQAIPVVRNRIPLHPRRGFPEGEAEARGAPYPGGQAAFIRLDDVALPAARAKAGQVDLHPLVGLQKGHAVLRPQPPGAFRRGQGATFLGTEPHPADSRLDRLAHQRQIALKAAAQADHGHHALQVAAAVVQVVVDVAGGHMHDAVGEQQHIQFAEYPVLLVGPDRALNVLDVGVVGGEAEGRSVATGADRAAGGAGPQLLDPQPFPPHRAVGVGEQAHPQADFLVALPQDQFVDFPVQGGQVVALEDAHFPLGAGPVACSRRRCPGQADLSGQLRVAGHGHELSARLAAVGICRRIYTVSRNLATGPLKHVPRPPRDGHRLRQSALCGDLPRARRYGQGEDGGLSRCLRIQTGQAQLLQHLWRRQFHGGPQSNVMRALVGSQPLAAVLAKRQEGGTAI